MAHWYFVKDGRREGPVSAEFVANEIRKGRLTPEDKAWSQTMDAWQPISDLPELTEVAAGTPPPLPAEAHAPAPISRTLPEAPTAVRVLDILSSFFQRATALLIDGALLFVPGMILLYLLTAIITTTNTEFDITKADDRIYLELLFNLCALPGLWLYNAGFESSKFQATPGKQIMGLKVTGANGERLSLARATARFFIKNLTLPIGFILALYPPKHQALHDLIAKTYVVPK